MIDRSHLLRAAAVAAITLAGCSSHSDSPRAKSGPGVMAGTAGPSTRFEAVHHDPPIKAETRFAAGQLAESRGALPQAVEQYRQALKIDPKYPDAMYRLGVVYAETKKYADAIDTWKRYIKVTGESPQAYSNLGFSYELAGRPEEAEGAYLKGIKKDGSNVPCRVNYGLMLVRRGRLAEGKIQLGAVLQPAEVRYNVGSVFESLGMKEQAKAEYRAAMALDPQLVDAAKRLEELEGGPAIAQPPAAIAQPPAPAQPASPQPDTGLSQTETKEVAPDGEPVYTD